MTTMTTWRHSDGGIGRRMVRAAMTTLLAGGLVTATRTTLMGVVMLTLSLALVLQPASALAAAPAAPRVFDGARWMGGWVFAWSWWVPPGLSVLSWTDDEHV